MFHLRKARFMRACAKLASSQERQKRFIFNVSRSTSAGTTLKVFPQLFGQPTSTTHPHLLKPGEVIPGISLQELKERRQKLASRILECGNSSTPQLIILPSASKVYMTDKIPYVFRQNTEFLYFTGCQEPDSILTILVRPGKEPISTLFVQPKHEHAELWDGPRTGPEKAVELFGIDESFSISKFEEHVSNFVKDNENQVWYDKENVSPAQTHKKLSSLLQDVATKCPKLAMHKLRLIKSPAEVELAKKSCEIASAAIAKTIEMSKVGMSEHQLFAKVDYECRMNGAEFLAYPPVVAAGNNANVIHYIVNNQIAKDGEMVLMDAGCEYHGYTSDITRTWPINGTFTDEQRVLYEIVLDVQKQLIRKLEEGPTLDVMFHEMCRLLGKRLKEIHLLPKHFTSDKQLSSGAFMYCPHHVSHYLGMDVHDTNQITRSTPVEEGMIVTVEPGIYVNPKSAYAPPEFYGLGIRIEDDILINKNGKCTVLTQSCPKEIEDIERLAKMNQCSV